MPKGLSSEQKKIFDQLRRERDAAELDKKAAMTALQQHLATEPDRIQAATDNLQQELVRLQQELERVARFLATADKDLAKIHQAAVETDKTVQFLRDRTIELERERDTLKLDGREALKEELAATKKRLARKSEELQQVEKKYRDELKLQLNARDEFIGQQAKQLQEYQAVLGMK